MQITPLLISLIIIGTFLGCGGSSSSSTQSAPSIKTTVSENNITDQISNKLKDNLADTISYTDLFTLIDQNPNKTALILDANGVQGLRILCNNGNEAIFTEQYGLFQCKGETLNIYLGNFKLGSVSKIPKDKVIYTQDILNLPRAATMHPDVTKISMILQSLDEDADLSNGIQITQESIDLLDNELSNFTNIEQLSIEDTDNIIDNVISSRKAMNPDSKLQKVSKKEAQINLTTTLANMPAKNLDISSFHSIAL